MNKRDNSYNFLLAIFLALIFAFPAMANITFIEVAEPTKIITVKPGDTLATLALQHFGDRTKYGKFLIYNKIVNANALKPGDRLQVPVSIVSSSPTLSSSPPVNSQPTVKKLVAKKPVIPVTVKVSDVAPPIDVRAFDTPNDAGKGTKKARGGIFLTWTRSADDVAGGRVKGYHVFRKELPDGKFEKITKKPAKARGSSKSKITAMMPSYAKEYPSTDFGRLAAYVDRKSKISVAYLYKVAAIDSAGNLGEMSDETRKVMAIENSFNSAKISVLISLIAVAIITLYFADKAQSGREMYIRRIPALDAFEMAVGRASEMGRPVLFIPGNDKIDQPSAMASVNIFEAVANYAVVMQTQIRAPNQRPIVNQVLNSSLKGTYLLAGRPDLYQEYDVHFDTDHQLAYAASMAGVMERENPAAIFLQGDFGAESLIFAEIGSASGAMQIAGTDNPKQLPYFIAACDYTLLGEELYAAGAYVKKDPVQISTLKAQDMMKLSIFLWIVLGVTWALSGATENFVLEFFKQAWYEVMR